MKNKFDLPNLSGLCIGCAMTGSFCTFRPVMQAWRKLRQLGAELTPIMSFNAAQLDTRFYSAAEAMAEFEEICGRPVLHSIPDVEPIGPKKLLDLLVIAPCTGNSLAKLANGIPDTPAVLAAKSHLRNGRPVVVAVSTNDGLGTSAQNIGRLLNMKHIYFLPFGQDDAQGKPNSLVAHFDLMTETIKYALEGLQIQPILQERASKP